MLTFPGTPSRLEVSRGKLTDIALCDITKDGLQQLDSCFKMKLKSSPR